MCHGTFEIVPQEVLWSIWRSHQTFCSLPLPNVRWHSGTWPYTMTPSIDQILHQFATLLPNLTLLPIFTLLPDFGGFKRTLQRVRLADRGRLLLRTPGHVPFGTCICSNVETILSWTCHFYGPFEFRTSFGTSILLRIKMFKILILQPFYQFRNYKWIEFINHLHIKCHAPAEIHHREIFWYMKNWIRIQANSTLIYMKQNGKDDRFQYQCLVFPAYIWFI